MLNIGSLVLGVGAWILGAFAIANSKTISSYRNTILSFVFCGSALVMQMFEINRRVLLGDYAAIEDTIRAVLIASCTYRCFECYGIKKGKE